MVNVKLTDFKKETKKQIEVNKVANKKNLTEEELKKIIAEQIIEELEKQLNQDDNFIEENYKLEHLGEILDELEFIDDTLANIEDNMSESIRNKITIACLFNGKELDYDTLYNILEELNPEQLYYNKYKIDTTTAFAKYSVRILKFLLKKAGLKVE